MKLAALQTDIVWEDREANFRRLEPKIAAAAASGARLVVLPEMFARGFSMDTQNIREPTGGPSSQFLASQCAAHGIWICGSIPESTAEATTSGGRPHNTLVVVSPDGQQTRYRKIHPFTFAKEDEHYAAGNDFVTLEIEGVRTTLFVCYDLRFADEFWATARQTDLFVVVANWPERRREHWRTLLRARAIENQCYVVGVNRVGEGSGLRYMGDSAIIDPWGAVLCEAARDEAMLIAEVDPERVAEARRKFPVLDDRR
jgi:predicted amidohydrolase